MSGFCDITGQRFGFLTALKRIENKGGRTTWLCHCHCGNEIAVISKNLKNGNTKSCGCQRYKEPENLANKRFGRLVVLERGNIKTRNIMWKCLCDCGATKIVSSGNLKGGSVRSCGCLANESTTRFAKVHGKSQSRLFKVWSGIKTRCLCTTDKHYKDYGGRGITLCEEWAEDFMAFHDWAMANGYDENAPKGECTIDRIDNDKGYSHDNCRFVNLKIQANNKRNNHVVAVGKDTLTIAEVADMTSLGYNTMRGRVNKGWDIESAINAPLNVKKSRRIYNPKYTYKGHEYTKTEISKMFGIDKRTFGLRLERGMSVAEAIETPVRNKTKAVANAQSKPR